MATIPDPRGTGIAFPVRFVPDNKRQLLQLSTGARRIYESLWVLFTTQLGERLYNPEYGCNIRSVLFQPNDAITKDIMYLEASTAINRWEKRITITNISVRTQKDDPTNPVFNVPDGDKLIALFIAYIDNLTNVPGNFVFPFVREAMPMNQMVQGNQIPNIAAGSNGAAV